MPDQEKRGTPLTEPALFLCIDSRGCSLLFAVRFPPKNANRMLRNSPQYDQSIVMMKLSFLAISMKTTKTVLYFLAALTTFTAGPFTQVYAGGNFCDPAHTRKIRPLAETGCNAALYAMFPKITEYKGQLWEPGPSCLYSGAASQSDLRVQYCKSGNAQSMDATGKVIGENLDFKMTVLDMEGPQYQSKISQSLLKAALFVFDARMLSPLVHNYQSSNSLFDKDMARVTMPSGASTTYAFNALYQKRFLITVTINGKDRFREPKDVDAFVLEYTQAMVAGLKP
jgi:hypothetical protein